MQSIPPVCILTSQYFGWGKIGGFGSMSRKLAEALADAGIETSVIVPRRPGQPAQEVVNGVTVHAFSPLDIRTAHGLIKRSPAGIFHSQDPTFLTLLAQIARRDAKHVVTCRDPRDTGDWLNEFRHATWGRRLRIPLNWLIEGSPLVRFAVRRAHGVYTPAYFLQDKVRRMYAPRAEVGMLPNLIDIPDAMPEKAGQPTFVSIGRLDKRKRPEIFLELARTFPDCHFILVGKAESDERERELRESYESLPNLRWEGYIDRFKEKERLDAILAESWALINTASREGLPLTFLEAAGAGCAIISFVNPDDFPARFGTHVADDDFAGALRALLDAPAHIHARGEAARAYVKETYEAGAARALHLEAYEAL